VDGRSSAFAPAGATTMGGGADSDPLLLLRPPRARGGDGMTLLPVLAVSPWSYVSVAAVVRRRRLAAAAVVVEAALLVEVFREARGLVLVFNTSSSVAAAGGLLIMALLFLFFSSCSAAHFFAEARASCSFCFFVFRPEDPGVVLAGAAAAAGAGEAGAAARLVGVADFLLELPLLLSTFRLFVGVGPPSPIMEIRARSRAAAFSSAVIFFFLVDAGVAPSSLASSNPASVVALRFRLGGMLMLCGIRLFVSLANLRFAMDSRRLKLTAGRSKN